MRPSLYSFQIIFVWAIIMYFLSTTNIFAQEAAITQADTVQKEPETIEMADISIKSGEATITTKRTAESLIPDEEIQKMGKDIDSSLSVIDSLMKSEAESDFSTANIRGLNNKLVFWYDRQKSVDDIKTSLSDVVQKLDKKKYHLEKEIAVWKNTQASIKKEGSAASVINRIKKLLSLMDSVDQLIEGKSDFVLKYLDHTTETGVKIEDLITSIDKMIIEKEGKVFEQNQPSIFTINYGDKSRWKIKGPLKQFYMTEVKQLDRYMKQHIPNFVFQVVLLLVLIFFFIKIRKRLQTISAEDSSVYKKMLVRIFQRPISAAILLGLFSSILIFENRPPIFKDISVIIGTIPLIIILISIVGSKNKKYIYLVGILILIRQVCFVFPAENFYYRFSLLAIAIIEFMALAVLLKTFIKHPLKKKFLNNLVLVLIILHLGSSFVGFIGIVIGSTMLAEIALNITIVNSFAGFLFIVSAFIFDGLTEIAIDSKSFQGVNIFRLYGQILKKKITDLINFGAIIYWIFTMMRSVNIDRPVIDWISTFVSTEWSIGSSTFTLASIFIFFFVIWFAMFIAKIIRIVLEEDVLDRFNLAKGVPRTISVMVNYALITMGILLAVSAAGLPMTSLTVLIGAFGVGIGFGLQNIFNNLVSGLILLFERPIQLDDTIEVGTLIGKVKSMGIRSSHVRTFDGAEVIVPNGQLISQEVVNWTLSDQQRRIEVIAGVAYGSDPHLVQKLFLNELESHPDILKDPSPNVFFQNMGESSLDFRLLFWTSNFSEWIRIRSDIIFKVHDILKENNIEIPFPQRDLHIRSIDQSVEIKNK